MTRILLDLFLFVAGVKLGDLAGKRRLLTKKRIMRTYLKATGGYGPWSIGMLEGSGPLDLKESSAITNPVLTGASVTDVDALFVADPFVVQAEEGLFMFFEIMKRRQERGCIGVAKSQDGLRWKYLSKVLEEDFHLSFPLVFEWKGEFYMVPESSDDWSVRLYKAQNFPYEWELIGKLVSGYNYKDPTIFRFDGLWWMFVSAGKNEIMNIYHAKELQGPWQGHMANPVIRNDRLKARSAGKVLLIDGRIYRFAQDNKKKYGRRVFAWEIEGLSPTEYREKPARSGPIVGPSGHGWNKAGMHTFNPFQFGGKWFACVDGRRF